MSISKKKRIGKKGILMHTSIEILIAAIVILFLIILGVQLYGIAIKSTEKEIAQSNLDKIIEEGIIGLEEGEKRQVFVEGPGDWALVYYDKSIADSNTNWEMPSKCYGNCLCMCPTHETQNIMSFDWFYKNEKMLGNCQNEGVCREFNGGLSSNIIFEIKSDSFAYSSVNWILHFPRDLYLYYEGGKKIISSSDGQEFLTNFLESETINGLSLKEYISFSVNKCFFTEGNTEVSILEYTKKDIKTFLNSNLNDETYFEIMVLEKDISFGKTFLKESVYQKIPKSLTGRKFLYLDKISVYEICNEDYATYVVYQNSK